MKTMKHLLLISLLFLSVLTKAQNTYLPDEIWYDTGKNIYIQFCLPSVYELNKYGDASKTFSQLYTGNIQNQIRKYDHNQKIRIKLDEVNKEYLIQVSNEVIHLDFLPVGLKNDSLTNLQELKLITAGGTKINCYFQDLNELMMYLKNDWTKSIDLLAAEIKKSPSANKRKVVTLLFRNNNGQIESISTEVNKAAESLNQLMITGGAGIAFFKGKLMPTFDGQLGFLFSRKGILKNHYFVNLELMYDFVSENNKLVPKTGLFKDLGYKHNFSKSPDKADWYGISVGYLSHKNSEIFDDNTWRISIYRNISKNIELVPQIYFPDNFSKVFPGLKINVSF